jgi:hypothetical protein
VADIFGRHGAAYRAGRRLPLQQLRVLRAIETCRTAALGGHVEQCGHCQHQRVSYNSCRNRHCPKCQNAARTEWVQRRQGELLPVDYFHVVFTIPEQLNALALQNQPVVYKILFDASARTLDTIAADPQHLGARIGFFSILHTWGQNLLHHPHLHCVATGGGLSPDGTAWVSCRPGFFLSVRVLSRLFRRLFLEALEAAFSLGKLEFSGDRAALRETFPELLSALGRIEWVVYAKPPFGGPRQVIEYLGRYTHRVAIDNRRIESMDDQQVSFQYQDYRSHGRYKSRHMTLSADEFIRRFLLHTLPPRFQRIRHYGLLASRNKKQRLLACRRLLNPAAEWLPPAGQIATCMTELPGQPALCPVCRVGQMIRIEILPCVRYRAATVDSS